MRELKIRLLTRIVVGLGAVGFIFLSFASRSLQLLKGLPAAPGIAQGGPCYQQTEVASTFGLDYATAQRARHLAAGEGLDICIDEQRPRVGGTVHIRILEIYAWASERAQVGRALFKDSEIQRETFPAVDFYFEEQFRTLLHPYWIARKQNSRIFRSAGVARELASVIKSPTFCHVAHGRVPSVVAVVKRSPVFEWGKSPIYEVYVRFGTVELDRFQLAPVLGVVYVGRVDSDADPEGLPFELRPEELKDLK